MKKFLLFAGTLAVGIGFANAAVRDNASISRQSAPQSSQPAPGRSATTTARNAGVITRTAATAPSRAATTRGGAVLQSARTAHNNTVISSGTARAATAAKSARTARTSAVITGAASISRAARAPARATTTSGAGTATFGTGYNTCRDAYFTCMDQFCAQQDTTYRRCVCSSKLADIKSRERKLSQTSDQLQDFKNLNIEVIPKTGAEVKAMMNATAGETIASTLHDNSDSAQKLAGISEVLTNTKSKALSTQGTLDIAGDINAIWATTDLTSGAQLANLTGETLYNAVHSQCVDLIAPQCASTATLNMVVAAYGMYIENDCATLQAALEKKYTQANAAIRNAESEMQSARLENYDAHNSTAINDCIAQVRKDITAETACGADYVHCLDVSGRYLNRDTGEPIYTADFYQLESAISLSGDILNNQSNRMIVNTLNQKRAFAKRGLETCRDLADDVWDEFMRQAITEIYQGQQERIRQVKNECLDVVNQCYDTQSKSLKDFSNVKEQLLLGSRLDLSEEMCQEKLNACSNLYGGGTQGMDALVNAMGSITDQKIAQQCQATLLDYAKEMCAVPSNDSLHAYPFGCRTYAPSSQHYAAMCYAISSDDTGNSGGGGDTGGGETPTPSGGYSCPTLKMYTACSPNYYMTATPTSTKHDRTPKAGNACRPCSVMGPSCKCAGGLAAPNCTSGLNIDCGDYNGSLYQKLVRYAQQTCVRPSESGNPLPSNVLQDVNVVMDSIRVDMAKELGKECERLGGIWIDTVHDDTAVTEETEGPGSRGDSSPSTGADSIYDKRTHPLWKKFYVETSASTKWGYCAEPNKDETLTPQEGCVSTGGQWNELLSECTCSADSSAENAKTWNATISRCVYKSKEIACTQTTGTWDATTGTCTCPEGKKLDKTLFECKDKAK